MHKEQIAGSENTHTKVLEYRPDIDGLRAIAILSVIIFHAFPEYLPGGFVGVDIFFTISGFLISSIISKAIEQNRFSLREFYAHRAKRILPALIAVLLICYVWGWLALTPPEFSQLAKHIAGGAGFVQNAILWNESGYFDTASELKPLMHLWSLAIEEQFYLLFPIVIWLNWKTKLKSSISIAALLLISLSLNLQLINTDPVQTFFSPATRAWELLAGALLAQLIRNPAPNLQHHLVSNQRIQNLFSTVGLLLITVSILLIKDGEKFPGWRAIFPVLGTCLLIVAGTRAWANRTLLSSSPMIAIGLISYPLYLWHWPLLSFSRIAEGASLSSATRMSIVLASFCLAGLTYKLIEKPIRFGEKKAWKTISLAAVLAATTALGYGTYHQKGLPERFPKIYRELATFKYEYKAGYREGSCFLTPTQNSSTLEKCETTNENGNKKPILFLWGDSHAAHLYPGYKANYSDDYEIRQRTASGCPPIVGMEIASRPFCRSINDHILNEIQKNKPERVVLAGIWNNYEWRKLQTTIIQLHSIGIAQVDLIGPVPQWKDGLPKQLLLSVEHSTIISVPTRLRQGLVQAAFKTDKEMSDYFKKAKVNYISPIDIFCNANGCMTRTGETANTLTAWDYGHLTTQGSKYLVSHIQKMIADRAQDHNM